MVKLVVKIVAFFLVFSMILGWMKRCEGNYIDKLLDDYFFSSSEEDKDDEEISYEDIRQADPDQFYRYVNVKIAFVYLIAWAIGLWFIKKPINDRIKELEQDDANDKQATAALLKKQLIRKS